MSVVRRLIPLLDRVLIEPIKPSQKTAAGLLLPESGEKINYGKVVAVGAGSRDKDGKVLPLNVKEGDTVLLPEYGGSQIKMEGKEYRLFRDADLLAILKE